jgi:chemotaxis signal transduction protein
MTSLLFFMVAGIRCAVPLHRVDHVVSMVLPAPAPDSRGGLAGNINLHGMTVPVYSMRYMLGLETRPPLLSDVLIITRVDRDRAGLWADGVSGVGEGTYDDDPGQESGPCVQVSDEGIVIIHRLVDLLNNPDHQTICALLPQKMNGIPRSVDGENERAAALFAERVRNLARPEGEQQFASFLELLKFRLAYREYAMSMKYIREVILTGSITPVPGTPDFITGICAVRGEIISLVDLRVLFSLSGKGLTDLNRVIVVSDGSMTFGILADSITGMVTIPESFIAPVDPGKTPNDTAYLLGVVEEMVVLDARSIIHDPRMVVDDTGA